MSARRALQNEESIENIRTSAAQWENSINLLCHATRSSEPHDLVTYAVERADALGVRVIISGMLPTDSGARSLLALSVRECTSNCLKHARSFRALCICIHKQLQLLCDRNKQRNASDARNNRRRRTFRSQAPCRKCRRRHVCHKPAAFRTCRVAAASMRSISFLKINIIECHCIHIFYCFYLDPSLIRAADTCILYYLISYVVSRASVNVYDIVGCVSIYIAPFFHEP